MNTIGLPTDPRLPFFFFPFLLPCFLLFASGNYQEYFGMNTDVDAVVYLMLVNNLLHDVFPNCITIGAPWASTTRAAGPSWPPAAPAALEVARPWPPAGLEAARASDQRQHLRQWAARSSGSSRTQVLRLGGAGRTHAAECGGALHCIGPCRRGRVGHARLQPALVRGRRRLRLPPAGAWAGG